MRYCIFGAGAIGGLVAARLAFAGEDVCVVAREPALEAISRRGIELILQDGAKKSTGPLRATDDCAKAGPCDVLVLALKANQLPGVAPRLAPLLERDTLVMPMQNGLPFWYFHQHGAELAGRAIQCVDPGGKVLEALDPRRVIGCVVYMAAERAGPASVRHMGGNRLFLGELDGSRSARVEALSASLTRAGFDAPVFDDIRAEVWLKLWGNLAFNAISALGHATLARVCGHEEGRSLAEQMMREAQAVAERLGVKMRASMQQRIEGAARVGAHKTSMLQDVEAGRALEIDALTGSVVELGEMVGIATPTIRAIYQAMKLLDATMRAEGAAVRLVNVLEG